MGRHSTYTPEIGAKICERLAAGESLRSVCRDEGMPDRATVSNWLTAEDDFFSQYTRARDSGLDVMADESIEIADKDPGVLPTGGTDSGAVNHQRLRVDTRKWYLSKLAPKRYGERTAVEVSGPDGGPIQFDDQGAAARIAAILTAAEQRRVEADNSDIA